MKKLMAFVAVIVLGMTLAACNEDNEADSETSEAVSLVEETSESTLNAVTVYVTAHENHDLDDPDHDEQYHNGAGIGDTHHFHFAVDVPGSVDHELHGASSHHFELKLTPTSGYTWSESVMPEMELPALLEGATMTHYVDDHGCLVIIVQFPA